MLTLKYHRADAFAATLAAPDLLGAALLDLPSAQTADIPLAAVQTAALGTAARQGWIESWHLDNPRETLRSGRCGAVCYRHAGELLFGSICIDEAGLAGDTLQSATAQAYREIFTALDRLGFPQLWRVWNFIPRINAIERDLERYRHFNSERQTEFLRSGRSTSGAVPVASAVGCAGNALTIYFLAGRSALQPIENPRQISAYHYPVDYGPSSPIFTRAGLVSLYGDDVLFISGTASIVGHRSLHIGDVAAQTRELTQNIDALLDEANRLAPHRRFTPATLAYKAYIRRPEDFPVVQRALRAWLGAAPVIYLQADICRSELLVEVEASGGHAISAAASDSCDDGRALRAAH